MTTYDSVMDLLTTALDKPDLARTRAAIQVAQTALAEVEVPIVAVYLDELIEVYDYCADEDGYPRWATLPKTRQDAALAAVRGRHLAVNDCATITDVLDNFLPCICETPGGYWNCHVPGVLAHVEDGVLRSHIGRCKTCERYDSDDEAWQAFMQVCKVIVMRLPSA